VARRVPARADGFPKGKHDDQVDSTAQMLDWFKRAGQEPQDWMWQMYKQAQARGPEPARPDPLSVMTKAWASSARYDHAEREERMLSNGAAVRSIVLLAPPF